MTHALIEGSHADEGEVGSTLRQNKRGFRRVRLHRRHAGPQITDDFRGLQDEKQMPIDAGKTALQALWKD